MQWGKEGAGGRGGDAEERGSSGQNRILVF